MKSLIVLVVAGLAFISAQQGTNSPNLIVLPVVVHDYFPCATNEWVTPPPGGRADQRVMANCNPDVDPYQTSSTHWGSGLHAANTGMVKSTLNSNRKMVYAMGPAPNGVTSSTYQTTDSNSFNRWWDSTWAGNFPIPYNFTLNLDINTGLYGISTDSFYPIDNQGWGNNGYSDQLKIHNWGFCVEAHAAFVYNSSAVLSFEGDDDMWIFMNNQLVFDIGGIHTAVKQTTRLGDFGWSSPMTEFASYPFDMFYCERQSAGSDIILTTTVNIYCPNNQFDACGVCQGKGDCCPACTDPNPCTIATLNPRNCQCNKDTTTKPNQCALLSDSCQTTSCSTGSGTCVSTAKPTPAINGCQTGSCNPSKGWIIQANNPCPTNDTKCWPTTCTPSGSTGRTCKNSTSDQCTGACAKHQCAVLPCQTSVCFNSASDPINVIACQYTSTLPQNNTCFGYTCAADNVTFVTTPLLVCTNSSNLCYNSTCDVNVNNGAGGCTPKVYQICNDNSNCTVDSCVESTGQCSYVDVVLPSSNNTCILASCDPEYGVTATNISCKGIDCVQDPLQAGCCICKGIPLGAIIGAGAIAGIAIGGAAAAGIIAFAGKKGFDYFGAGNAAAAGVQENPMYVAGNTGGTNPLYQ